MTMALTEPTQLLDELTQQPPLLPAVIFGQLVNDHGFDPEQPGPDIPEFEPWTVRGAMEAITGQAATAWTVSDAAQLVMFLSDPEPGKPVFGDLVRAEHVAEQLYRFDDEPRLFTELTRTVGGEQAASLWVAAHALLAAHDEAITADLTVDNLAVLIADWDGPVFEGDYFTRLRERFGPETAADMWKQACTILDDEDMSEPDDMVSREGDDGDPETSV